MARPGVDREKIREVIAELERQGQVVTVRAVRERVGGSNSTLLAEIQAWRTEVAARQKMEEEQRALPALPETLAERLRLWATEIWREAVAAAEAENRLLRQQLAESARRYGQLEAQTSEEVEAVLGENSELRAERDKLEASFLQALADMKEYQIRNEVLSELLRSLGPAVAPRAAVPETAPETVVPAVAPETAVPEVAPETVVPAVAPEAAVAEAAQDAAVPGTIKQQKKRSATQLNAPVKKKAQPNEEQQAVISAVAKKNQIVAVNALAGTGKTSTLEFLAQSLGTQTKIHYLVFNARNAAEARSRMPKNVQSMTAHSMAYHSPHPNTQEPMKSFFSAICPSVYPQVKEILKTQNHRDICAVSETISNFCHSADNVIGEKHLPVPIRVRADKKEMDTYVFSAQEVFQALAYTRGKDVSHDVYLKICSLFPPTLPSDLVLVDEAQDLNPCMISIIEHQIKRGKQVVLVGDAYQHIYGFTGAVNAMQYFAERYPQTVRLPLTGSYRFGREIAEVANYILEAMRCNEQLRGLGEKGIVDDRLSYPDGKGAIIYRKNISMIRHILSFASAGKKIQIIGGTSELKSLLIAVSNLYQGEKTSHKEVGLFVNYEEFKAFSDTDAGRHFLPIIKYVEEKNGDVSDAINALDLVSSNTPRKGEEYITLSTAHKAKGLEFPSVALCDDMQAPFFVSQNKPDKPDFDELALVYVAATRAQKSLHTNELLNSVEDYLGFALPNIEGIHRKRREKFRLSERDQGLSEDPVLWKDVV